MFDDLFHLLGFTAALGQIVFDGLELALRRQVLLDSVQGPHKTEQIQLLPKTLQNVSKAAWEYCAFILVHLL